MSLRIGVITAGRSDFGIYLPLLRALRNESNFELVLIATGTHMDARFGKTVCEMTQAGFSSDYSVPLVPATDCAAAISTAMGQGIGGFSKVYDRADLDLLLVLGDRFEMFAAATAAVPFRLPLVHLHGGEVTEGAMDEQFRHAISKLSHLHFVSTSRYRDRLLQLGEEPWRVVVTGAPGLDHLNGFAPWSRARLEKSLQITLEHSPLLVTFHPVTLCPSEHVDPMLHALNHFPDHPVIITGTNSDVGFSEITERLHRFVAKRPNALLVPSLGTERYFSLMSCAAALVGNSSSGIIEAASFELPVVNIGDRQKGRVRGGNVLDVSCRESDIVSAIQTAISAPFRASLVGMDNPYGNGGAAKKIVRSLRALASRSDLLQKRFVDRKE